jgi:hypothetical protein
MIECMSIYAYIHAVLNNDDNYQRNQNVTGIMIILIYGIDVVIAEKKRHQHLLCMLSE